MSTHLHCFRGQILVQVEQLVPLFMGSHRRRILLFAFFFFFGLFIYFYFLDRSCWFLILLLEVLQDTKYFWVIFSQPQFTYQDQSFL